MKKSIILIGALAAVISGGCMNESASKEQAEKISESTVSTLDSQTRTLLDTFRDEAQDLYDQLRELEESELSSEDAQKAKENIKSQFEALYEGTSPAFEETYNALKDDPELRESLDALKEQTKAVYDQAIKGGQEIVDGDKKELFDLSKLTEAMKNFDMSYMKANNMR